MKTKKFTQLKKDIRIDMMSMYDVHQILDPCPDEGGGVNQAVLGACSRLHKLGYSEEEITPMVLEWAEVSVSPERLRHIEEVELPRALQKATNSTGEYLSLNPHVVWPKSDPEDVLNFATQWGATTTQWESVQALMDSSPVNPEEGFSTADWLSLFFQDHENICLAESAKGIRVDSLHFWKQSGEVEHARYFTPNPYKSFNQMDAILKKLGLKIMPMRFTRCDKEILTRRYLNTEMDISLKDKSGKPSVWADVLKQYGIFAMDVQASIIRYLQSLNILELHSVLWSGTKSLHALWKAKDYDTTIKFYQEAVRRGVDRCHYPPSQLARCYVPNLQPLLWLNPPIL